MFPHPQYTVATPVALEGVGLHTGRTARVTISPSERGSLTFIRNGHRFPVDVAQVSHTTRCTSIGGGDCGVSTVEHLLASLSALNVTGADLGVDGPEIPILDGSAAGFVRLLRQAGLREIPGNRRCLRITQPVWLEEGACSLLAVPSETFRVTAGVSYRHPLVGVQMSDIVVGPETFEREVAPARTFGFEEELEELARRGLALGGSLENALVFFSDHTSSPLRFPDEPVRHKVLDVIGDLSLIGALPLVHVWAIRPSHKLNVAFARLLLESGEIIS
ncbi:MAG TPA: UDP-3-O-acyl-N-acetylglucosamine deacetylase [Armatimonadota bacterium]|jgi:UDP-3-O-[3-hydroxymyristoyl] N-acetylglucosamine deacetylase